MRVLMVCLGNICRSPIAEGLMRSMAASRGLSAEVDSAGTVYYHVGEKADKRSIACLQRHGIDITQHRARLVKPSDFDYYDIIYAMDNHNLRELFQLADNETKKLKVKLLLSHNPVENQEVPDPYYGTESDFETVYELCKIAIEKILTT